VLNCHRVKQNRSFESHLCPCHQGNDGLRCPFASLYSWPNLWLVAGGEPGYITSVLENIFLNSGCPFCCGRLSNKRTTSTGIFRDSRRFEGHHKKDTSWVYFIPVPYCFFSIMVLYCRIYYHSFALIPK